MRRASPMSLKPGMSLVGENPRDVKVWGKKNDSRMEKKINKKRKIKKNSKRGRRKSQGRNGCKGKWAAQRLPRLFQQDEGTIQLKKIRQIGHPNPRSEPVNSADRGVGCWVSPCRARCDAGTGCSWCLRGGCHLEGWYAVPGSPTTSGAAGSKVKDSTR